MPVAGRDSAVDKQPPLLELTGARFVAAAVVLLGHCYALGLPRPARVFEVHNRAAVAFFFVLSGFVLAYNYGKRLSERPGRSAILEFAQARFARIYPVHALVLIASAPLTLWLLRFSPWFDNLAGNPGPARLAVSFALSAALLQIYTPSFVDGRLWNDPSHTIATEAAFYLMFPVFCLLVLPCLKSRRAYVVTAAAAYVLGALLTLSLRPLHVGYEFMAEVVYKLPVFRIWEFFVGCCLGMLVQLGPPPGLQSRAGRDITLALALAWCVGVVLAVRKGWMADYLHWYVAYTPAFAVILLALSCGRSFLTPILATPLAVLLGEASYSLYMIHGPIVRVLECVYPPRTTPRLLILAVIVECVLLSIACYRWFELPARNYLRRRRRPAGG